MTCRATQNEDEMVMEETHEMCISQGGSLMRDQGALFIVYTECIHLPVHTIWQIILYICAERVYVYFWKVGVVHLYCTHECFFKYIIVIDVEILA